MTATKPPRPPVEPFRLLLAAVCVFYGALACTDFQTYGSPAIKALNNDVLAYSFLAGLIFAGAMSVYGTLRRWPRWEGAGLFMLAFVWSSFAVLGYLNSGGRAAAFSSFLGAFSLAALWAWAQSIVYPWWRERRAARKVA